MTLDKSKKGESRMEQYKLGDMEEKFAELIWEVAPIAIGDLIKQCEFKFSWKRTTTYTMLKRLCERGLFENEGGTVKVKMLQEDFRAAQGEKFIEDTFGGSLPSFLVAFSKRRKLKEEEIEELKKMIEEYEE